MSPPERTFGPIGWKGLFGDDEESDDEASTGDEGSAGGDGRESPGGAVSTDSRPAESAGGRAPSGSDRSAPGGGSDTTSRPETEEAIREERSRRARELSEEDAETDADADPLDGWKTLDELPGDERADRSTGSPDPGGRRPAPSGAATGSRESESGASRDESDGVAPEWTDASSGAAGGASEETESASSDDDGGLRDRIDAFYARYFLPPSVTGDDVVEEEPGTTGSASGAATSESASGSGSDATPDTASTAETDETANAGASAGSAATAGTGASAGRGAATSTDPDSGDGASAGPETTAETDAAASSDRSAEPTSDDATAAAAGGATAGATGRDASGSSGDTRRGTGRRREAENAESPPREPRVRTARSDTEPEPETSTSEKTLGPIGLKWLSDDDDGADQLAARAEESPTRTDETATTADAGRSAGTVDLDRHRTTSREDTATDEERLTDRVPWSVSITAIAIGVGLLVFIDIVSMMVPLIAAIGAGIVGGFVAGYIAGGTFRGAAHALAVGVIGGIAVGYLTALIGALIGLFLEPATLLGGQVGPIAPDFGTFGSWGPLLVMVFVTAMVAIDATIGGVVGGTLRSMVDEVR